jgi:predicted  nucleic acid-binding Zn-ribbon protein
VLEHGLREAEDELRTLRPRSQALEFELEGAKEEVKSLSSLNLRLKERLSTLRKSIGQDGGGLPAVLAPAGPDI